MSKNIKKIVSFLLVSAIFLSSVVFLAGCSISKEKLVILSGSENETLEPILADFEKANNVDIVMKYEGSVDIMLDLEKRSVDADAVWPANSLWITLGDKNRVVKYAKSIMTSPVVFGIRKSLAQQLGFTSGKVSVNDILKAIDDKKLSFMMTSASQSNSGASAYIGFLYALLGNPETITMDDLHKPELADRIRKLLSGINRSSGSSGWLRDLFLKGNYDAMVNYESMIIEANRQLTAQGNEPLYAVYPYDGLVIADSPLGYIDKDDSKKEELFNKLQQYLLSPDVQKRIAELGRRVGVSGSDTQYDTGVFNPDWGIDTKKILSPIRLPSADVIMEALNLYQTEFKKPSYTIFCLDFSGSMAGDGQDKLKEAMRTLLDQQTAKKYLLNSSKEDVVGVIPFSSDVLAEWKADGSSDAAMNELLQNIEGLSPTGSTDIYSPVIQALEEIKGVDTDKYIASVVLMTDGESNYGRTLGDLQAELNSLNKDIPVFSIMFGEASEKQLDSIADLTRAKVFDGKADLISAFKSVRGYN